MLRISNLFFFFGLAMVLLGMGECSGRGDGKLPIDKSKSGGLYEVKQGGKILYDLEGIISYEIDTANFIPWEDFAFLQEDTEVLGEWKVTFSTEEYAIDKLHVFTLRNVDKFVCIMLGDKVFSSPKLVEPISGGKLTLWLSDGDRDPKSDLETLKQFLVKK